jgi:hypothetical protein
MASVAMGLGAVDGSEMAPNRAIRRRLLGGHAGLTDGPASGRSGAGGGVAGWPFDEERFQVGGHPASGAG